MISHVTVLTNPASGHGNAPHAAERAIAQWQRRGLDTVEIVGRDGAHARELLREALDRGTDAVAVTGGDGVIALALQELAGGRVPLAIVPAGTGNDHAREYRLPTGDPAAAADVILDGRTETVDLGLIRGADGAVTWFGTVAATGFDSLVSDRVNRMRWPHGRMRYNLAIVAELSRLRLLPFRLVLDGEREIIADLTLAAVLLVAAFFAKQTAAPCIVFIGLGLLPTRRPSIITFAVVGCALFALCVTVASRASDGWFWTYIFRLHQGHPFHSHRAYIETPRTLITIIGAALALVPWALLSGWLRQTDPDDVEVTPPDAPISLATPHGLSFLAWLALGGLLTSMIAFGTQWAHTNAYIPGVFFPSLAIARHRQQQRARAEQAGGTGRWGTPVGRRSGTHPQLSERKAGWPHAGRGAAAGRRRAGERAGAV